MREMFENTLFGFLGLSFLLVVSAFTGLTFPLFLIAVLTVAIPILRHPESGLHILILATMVYGRLFALQAVMVGENEIKFFLFDAVIALTIFSLFLKRPARSFVFPKAISASILLYAVIVFLWAGMSFRQGGEPALTISAVKNMAAYPFLFFVVLQIVRDRGAWERVIATMIVGGLLMSAFIVYGILAGKGLWVDITPLSTEGTRLLGESHSFFALLAIIIMMSSIALRAAWTVRFGRWMVPMFSLLSLGIAVGLFRNLWIGYALSAVVTFVFLPTQEARRRLLGLFVKTVALSVSAVLLGAWLSVLLASNVSVLESFGRPLLERLAIVNPRAEDTSTTFRAKIFQEGMRLFRTSPVIGVGFGQSIDVEMEDWAGEQDIRELHNTYAEIAVQMGMVGLAAFVAILAALGVAGRRAYRVVPAEFKPFMIAAVTFLVTLLTITAFGTYFQTNMYLLFFWTAAALLVAPVYFRDNTRSDLATRSDLVARVVPPAACLAARLAEQGEAGCHAGTCASQDPALSSGNALLENTPPLEANESSLASGIPRKRSVALRGDLPVPSPSRSLLHLHLSLRECFLKEHCQRMSMIFTKRG